MKKRCCVGLLLLIAGACSGDSDQGATGEGDAGRDSDLQCDTYAWCTTYGATSEPPSTVPPLVGGTLSNGVYRAQEGTFSAEAFAIEGDTFVFIGDGYRNELGTWSVSGDTLTVTMQSSCDFEGTKTLEADDRTYLFAVEGSSVYLDSQDCFGTCEPERYQRVSSLCTEDQYFSCDVTNCQCVEQTNQGLPQTTGNPTSQCL